MGLVRHDSNTLREGQEQRFHRAERDIQRHERARNLKIILLLTAAVGLTAAGISLFHFLG